MTTLLLLCGPVLLAAGITAGHSWHRARHRRTRGSGHGTHRPSSR